MGVVVKHSSILRFYYLQVVRPVWTSSITHWFSVLHSRQHLWRFVSPQDKKIIATWKHICFCTSSVKHVHLYLTLPAFIWRMTDTYWYRLPIRERVVYDNADATGLCFCLMLHPFLPRQKWWINKVRKQQFGYDLWNCILWLLSHGRKKKWPKVLIWWKSNYNLIFLHFQQGKS